MTKNMSNYLKVELDDPVKSYHKSVMITIGQSFKLPTRKLIKEKYSLVSIAQLNKIQDFEMKSNNRQEKAKLPRDSTESLKEWFKIKDETIKDEKIEF